MKPTPPTSGAASVSGPSTDAVPASPDIRHQKDTRSLFSVRIHPEDVRCEDCGD